MLGVDGRFSDMGSEGSNFNRRTEEAWLCVVAGEDGLSDPRLRGVVDSISILGLFEVDLSDALTLSILTSDTVAFGAATPKPRLPRLICLMNFGGFAVDDGLDVWVDD